ncbi:unnamed protein product [Arabidopsis halleri]
MKKLHLSCMSTSFLKDMYRNHLEVLQTKIKLLRV